MNSLITSPELPPLPSLSVSLLEQYRQLTEQERKLFRVLYRGVWDYLCPLSSLLDEGGAMSYYFLLPPLLDEYGLIPSDLSVLSRLWLYSGGGRRSIHTTKKFNSTDNRRIALFVRRGFLSRHYFDPLQPYSFRSFRPVWLSFSPLGVQFYKQLNNAFRMRVMAFHLNDVTGSNKKGQPNGLTSPKHK